MTTKFSIIDISIERFYLGGKISEPDREISVICKSYMTRTVQEITDRAYYARGSSKIRETDCIVFRLEPTINWFEYRSQLTFILESFRQKSGRNSDNDQLVIYTSDFVHNCICVAAHNSSDPRLQEPEILSEIRQYELVQYLDKSSALYHHNAAALFDLPSNQFSDFFLRVGNIQSKRGFISSIFFWMIPMLRSAGLIAVDSWSISTTAARIAQKAATYGADLEPIEWDYLSSYLPNSAPSQELIESFFFSAGSRKRELIFLCSLLSSGKVENTFYNIQGKFGSPFSSKIISIYTNSNTLRNETIRLCQISQYLAGMSLKGKDLEFGRGDRTIYSVDPDTYFPDYRKISPKIFRKGDAEDKPFFEKYAGRNIMSVHRSGRTSYHFSQEEHDTRGRHHAFHIDALELFNCSEFKNALWQKCKSFPNFDAVIADASTGSRKLYDVFAENPEIDECDTELIEFPAFSKIDQNEEFVALLRNEDEKNILVIIPTIISGATLGDLQIKLRNIGSTSSKFRFLVGLFRPPDQRKIDELLGEYLKPNQIIAVEQLIIPNWQEDRCPWCLERDAIQKVLKSNELEENEIHILSARLNLLTDGIEEGLKGTNVYFVGEQEQRLEFNPGSLILDLSQIGIKNIEHIGELADSKLISDADLCCATASAIQRWRLRVSKTEVGLTSIAATTIANNNGFNEARLRASIWRSLEKWELVLSSRTGQDFRDLVDRVFYGPNDDTNFKNLEFEATLAFGKEIPRALGTAVQSWDQRLHRIFCE